MKKAYFLASMLAVGALCSCSNDTEVISGVPQGGNNANDDLQPIVLSLGAPSISVRGTGTVGSLTTDAGNNVWKGQYLHLVMMEKSSKEDNLWWPSSFDYNPDGTPQTIYNFNHTPVKAETEETTSTLTWDLKEGASPEASEVLKYYRSDGSTNQFFAYRIDDAAADYTKGANGMDGQWALNTTYNTAVGTALTGATWLAEKPTVYDENGDKYFDGTEVNKPIVANAKKQYVYFQINGTQDLMSGIAEPNTSGEGAQTWYETPGNEDKIYSNVSARHNVVPNINMKHLLTRLVFNVAKGSATSDLTVTGIRVYSKDKGRMCVAYQENPTSVIEWNTTYPDADADGTMISTDAFTLNYRPAADNVNEMMKPITSDDGAVEITATVADPKENTTYQQIGEAMMVAPLAEGETVPAGIANDRYEGQSGYVLEIDIKETLSAGTHSFETITTQTALINLGETATTGKSYNINITLYGSEAITVEATLTGWEAGDDVDITPGEE